LEENQKQFDAARAELWETGSKRVVSDGSLEHLLERIGCGPDFETSLPTALKWTGRRDGDTRIYFVSNQQDNQLHTSMTFRAKGMQPELWDPETGEIRELKEFKELQNGVSFVHHFDIRGSAFFVFRKNAKAKGLPATPPPPALAKPDIVMANAAWHLAFPKGKERLPASN
jgi:hypothetical protein